jgi:hypothetical protein
VFGACFAILFVSLICKEWGVPEPILDVLVWLILGATLGVEESTSFILNGQYKLFTNPILSFLISI